MKSMLNIESQNFARRFTHLLDLLSSPKFLAMEGLGNEIPFFICPFPIKQAKQMSKDIEDLKVQLRNKGIDVLDVNLYRLSLKILEERDILDSIIQNEHTIDKAQLCELLQNVLDSENHLVPQIEKEVQDSQHKILFITGIGEVFPYIRLHTVLNNMQKISHNKPTVFFFPGEYNAANENGSTLSLFGVMDDKYYRAFNIFDCLPK